MDDDPVRNFQPWHNGEAVEGPAALYRLFVAAAMDEFIPELAECDDRTLDVVQRAVTLAVDITCQAAGVEESWDVLYARATAHLRS